MKTKTKTTMKTTRKSQPRHRQRRPGPGTKIEIETEPAEPDAVVDNYHGVFSSTVSGISTALVAHKDAVRNLKRNNVDCTTVIDAFKSTYSLQWRTLKAWTNESTFVAVLAPAANFASVTMDWTTPATCTTTTKDGKVNDVPLTHLVRSIANKNRQNDASFATYFEYAKEIEFIVAIKDAAVNAARAEDSLEQFDPATP